MGKQKLVTLVLTHTHIVHFEFVRDHDEQKLVTLVLTHIHIVHCEFVRDHDGFNPEF